MPRSLAFLAPLVLAACASAAEPAATPTVSPIDTLRAGGSFGFVLDESDPGTKLHAKCDTEHPGDAPGAAACYDAIRQIAAREGIRFSVDAAGHLVWTSFGAEDGKPATYVEVPLEASLDKDGVVAAKQVAVPRGRQVDAHDFPADAVLRFQVVDADTIVMPDPHKGRLVFRRLPGAGG
ncbi:MAG TPA: hypothetical protein VGL81_20720 [Polyangiaceae bacterium]|jgi:hypothetical protein